MGHRNRSTSARLAVRTDCWQASALARRGDIAVVGGLDGETTVWEVTSGRLLRALGGHDRKVTSVSLSADARIALTGSEDATARLWNLESGECLTQFDAHGASVDSVALSADAQVVATCSHDRTLRIQKLEWDYLT